MKKTILKIIAIFAISGVTFQSCIKKDEVTPTTNSSSDQEAVQSNDASFARDENDNALNDVNTSLGGTSMGRIEGVAGKPSGADTVIVDGTNKKVTIKYSGSKSNDGLRTREGEIVAQLTKGTSWNDKDAELTVSFNLTVTRNLDSKKVKISGNQIITNTSGGNAGWVWLFGGTPVVHSVSGTTNVTFDNGSSRSWTTTKKRTFTKLTVTVSALNSDNIIETGTNRFDQEFTNKITTPVVLKLTTGCTKNQFKATAGVITHDLVVSANKTRTVTVTFGLKALSTPTTDECEVKGFSVVWTKDNATQGYAYIQAYQ